MTCKVGDLDAGQSVSFRIATLVDKSTVAAAGGPTSITNKVSVAGAGTFDTNQANNTATDTALVNDSADLQITKVCKPDTTIQTHEPIQCTVYVDNHGPSDARTVAVTDVIRANAGVTITVSGLPSNCTLSPTAYGQQIDCSLGTVGAATTTDPGRTTVTYEVSADHPTDLNNLATVRSDTPDPNAANNTASVALTIIAGVADLALTATTPATVVAGTDMQYVLTVTDKGPLKALNTVLTDALPAGVSVVSAVPSQGTCTPGTPGNPLDPTTCQLGTVFPSTPPVTVTITVHVAPDTSGILHNSARVTSDTFDPDTSNNLVSGSTKVLQVADLAVTMSAAPNPVVAGRTLTYTSAVTNLGPSVARSTKLTEKLPSGTSFTASHITGGTGSCTLTNSTLTCDLDTLGLGQTVNVAVDVKVKPSVARGSKLTSTASVTTSATDPVSANNSASASSTVDTLADVSVTIISDKDTYKNGATIQYTITVTNTGPSDAQSVTLKVTLPSTNKAVYVSNSVGCPRPSGTTLTCKLGTLAAGGVKTVKLDLRARSNNVVIIVTAAVTSPTADPDNTNNTASRQVMVK